MEVRRNHLNKIILVLKPMVLDPPILRNPNATTISNKDIIHKINQNYVLTVLVPLGNGTWDRKITRNRHIYTCFTVGG